MPLLTRSGSKYGRFSNKVLLKNVLNFDFQNGLTALHLSSKEGNVDIVKELLKQELGSI